MAHDKMMEAEMPEEGVEAEGAGDPAAMMNDKVQEIIAAVGELQGMAAEYGMYNDRASLAALDKLARQAQEIYDRWMTEEGEAPEAEEAPAEAELPTGKLIRKYVASNGPMGGPAPRPDELTKPNAYGGQILKVKR